MSIWLYLQVGLHIWYKKVWNWFSTAKNRLQWALLSKRSLYACESPIKLQPPTNLPIGLWFVLLELWSAPLKVDIVHLCQIWPVRRSTFYIDSTQGQGPLTFFASDFSLTESIESFTPQNQWKRAMDPPWDQELPYKVGLSIEGHTKGHHPCWPYKVTSLLRYKSPHRIHWALLFFVDDINQ